MRSILEPLIRSEQPSDADAIAAVHRAAFRREDEPRLVARLRQQRDFHPQLSLIAEVSDAIVGHILFTPISIESEETSAPALALAPLAVLPEHQRKGIGSRLVEAGIQGCRAGGHRLIIVLGHPRYYPRFGFVEAAPLGITCPFPVPPETFMALDLGGPGCARAKGRVRYPAPFSGVADSA